MTQKLILTLLLLVARIAGGQSVSYIGNTGLPATTTGHVPFWFTGMAADSIGHVYTVSTWDEPHQDVIMWDAITGQKLYNTRQVQTGVFWNSIGVEPDGSFAYATAQTNETPAVTYRLYKIQLGVSPSVINFTNTGGSILLGTGEAEAKLLVKVTRYYVAVYDRNTGIVTRYDKTSGKVLRKYKGTLPDDTTVFASGFPVTRYSVANGAGARLVGIGWEQRCTEFAGSISYSQANPDLLISSSRNLYDRNGSWLGCGVNDITVEPATSGPCKTITLGGNDFLYFPLEWRELTIYRLSGISMTNVVQVNPGGPPGGLSVNCFNVSPDGTLWLPVNHGPSFDEHSSIWKLPLNSLDASGNPVYNWSDAVQIVTQAALFTDFSQTVPGSIEPMMVAYNAHDSIIYALLYIPSLGPDRGGAWMGGNILAAFDPSGNLLWNVHLSSTAVGMAVLPSGGVIVGRNDWGSFGTILRYDATGTLVATISPPAGDPWPIGLASGPFDQYGALNAELAPDGLLDIFAEDDFNGRVIWYHTP